MLICYLINIYQMIIKFKYFWTYVTLQESHSTKIINPAVSHDVQLSAGQINDNQAVVDSRLRKGSCSWISSSGTK